MEWDFNGDGKIDASGPIDINGDGNYLYTYHENGDFRALATVKDDRFGTSRVALTVQVFEGGRNIEEPVAKFTIDPDPPQGEVPFKVVVNGASSRDLQGPIVLYTWNWGDGSKQSTGVSAEHTYERAGTFKLKLTVLDTDDNSASRTRTVLATGDIEEPDDPEINRAPTAVVNVDVERGTAPLTVRFDGSGSSDADNDELTYAWDFGDGTTGQGRVIVHTFDQVGTFFARLTVEDGNGGRGSRTQRIIVEPSLANHAPRAFIGSGRRTGTAPLNLTFVSTSVDPDGDPLSYLWEFMDAESGEIIGVDESGAAVSFRFEEVGRFQVQLTVTDPAGASDTAPFEVITVTARVEPTPGDPLAGNGGVEEPPPPPRAVNFCGFGMMTGLIGSLMGLGLLMLGTRRRF